MRAYGLRCGTPAGPRFLRFRLVCQLAFIQVLARYVENVNPTAS